VGTPGVLGYRWNLKDEDAAPLALDFYENLLTHLRLDVALFRARQAMQEKCYDSETWASPVLVTQEV
jgi:CHAT domain-containing protein